MLFVCERAQVLFVRHFIQDTVAVGRGKHFLAVVLSFLGGRRQEEEGGESRWSG